MFDNRSISILAYNLETVLAEKIETVLSRNIANTRPRDYYDVHILYALRGAECDKTTLRRALERTTQKRGSGKIKEAITTAYPETEQQRCIVHMVRNTLKYVANKDMKEFAKDLKTVYTALDEEAALEQLERVNGKWSPQYPYAMKRWYENWDAVSPIFKFSAEVRKAFYTTNAIESLNATLRRLNRQRSVFPSAQALLKALYLATFEATRKWTMPIRNWGQILGELAIMYPDRIPE